MLHTYGAARACKSSNPGPLLYAPALHMHIVHDQLLADLIRNVRYVI